MEKIILYNDKKDCCGCGACMNACPKSAISMKEDEYGFIYPQIDYRLCVSCGRCKKVCGYSKADLGLNQSTAVYAAASAKEEIILHSASGGIFADVATHFLQNNGVVYGCSMEYNGERLTPKHIRIDSADELYKLQGSKYVQSNIDYSYKSVKQDLSNGTPVLFSGTPCQVGGLYAYLGTDKTDKLFTIDILCHGTPSIHFFQSYIKAMEKKLYGKVTNFSFRDKRNGWELYYAMVSYIDKNGHTHKKGIRNNLSSYYSLFLDSLVNRESCYSCKYAQANRVGDITIGDYWGIEEEHPDYLAGAGGALDNKKGISCILVNTEAGKGLLKHYGSNLIVLDSDFKKAAKRNGQLNAPSKRSPEREVILDMFKTNGYEAVDRWYFKKLGAKRYAYQAWDMMPYKLRSLLKKALHRK